METTSVRDKSKKECSTRRIFNTYVATKRLVLHDEPASYAVNGDALRRVGTVTTASKDPTLLIDIFGGRHGGSRGLSPKIVWKLTLVAPSKDGRDEARLSSDRLRVKPCWR